MMHFIKKNTPYFVILIVAVLTWYKILTIVPIGEGYYYFAKPNIIDFKYLSFSYILGKHDFFSALIFSIILPIFRDKLSLYMYLQFGIMIASYFVFYWVILKIFKDRWQALLTTIFFIANYIGQFTMMGGGDYQRFIQRVPQIAPVCMAFLVLLIFLRSGKMKYFYISFCLYVLSLIFLHYTSFFLPLFVLLPFFFACIYKSIKIKKTFLPIVLFTLTTIFIIRTDSLSRPKDSMLKFALETPHITQMVAYQISITGFPTEFTTFLANHSKPQIRDPYTQILTPILFSVVVYLYVGFLVIRKNKEVLVIYLTMISSVFIVAFLIMYAYDKIPNPLTSFGEDRIYFIQSILFAIIWGIVIKFLFEKLKNNYKIICVVIALLFLLQNLPSIWNDMNSVVFHSEVIKKYLSYIKKVSPEFTTDSVLISPWEPLTASSVINDFYTIPPTNIFTTDNWQKNLGGITNDRNKVFVFDVKYFTDSYGNYDPNSIEIVDLTEKFRKTGRIY